MFSLPAGEGSGALLAAAAGDVAGGADPRAYSWVTQTATVVAYHVLENDGVDPEALVEEWQLLDHTESGIRCYRAESKDFRRFLDSGRPVDTPSSEPASRIGPVGVWFRRRPDRLVEAAIELTRITHSDPSTIVVTAATAGAVAAACFAQIGRDLVYAAVETGRQALQALGDSQPAEGWLDLLEEAAGLVLEPPRETIVRVGGPEGPVGLRGAIAGIVLASAPLVEPVKAIEAGAMAGGSEVGAVVGSIIGARVGLRRWPWPVANDTWFAEIGRRMVDGSRETRDLPIPFAVEERMTVELNRR